MMTPNEMRDAKAREITKIAQDLGWEALVEIEGYKFLAKLFAKGASEQEVEGKLSQAEKLLDEFGGPEFYPAVEEYELVPLGIKDEAADLDEFVEHDAGVETSDEEKQTKEEDDVTSFEDETPAKEEGLHEDVHDDPESVAPVNLHGYSPKELHTACEIDDQDRGGIPRPNQLKETPMEGYVKTATRIIAEKGFVVVVRPPSKDYKVQRFASINLSHARALRDGYGYSINIASL